MSKLPGGFDPSVPSAGESGGSSTLPNGQYDIYNLGKIATSTILLGAQQDSIDRDPIRGPGGFRTHPNISSTPVTSTPTAWIQQIAGLSVSNPQAFAQWQQQLYSAGFYGSSTPRYGVWRDEDAKAAKAAVVGYLGVVNPNSPTPLTLADYLDHAAEQGAAQLKAEGKSGTGIDGGAGAQRQVSLTDPEALRAQLQSVARAQLGHDLSDTQLDGFVTAFHSSETAAQTSTDPSVTAPNGTADALSYLHQNFGTEQEKHQVTGYMNALLNLFLPSGSARPNLNVDPNATS